MKKKLLEQIAGEVLPCVSGIIINSYYDNKRGTGAFVDILTQDEAGSRPTTHARVPILKVGGFSTSLPPVGSTAIMGFMDNNESKPFLIGYLDSEITQVVVADDRSPRKPPTILTR